MKDQSIQTPKENVLNSFAERPFETLVEAIRILYRSVVERKCKEYLNQIQNENLTYERT